MARLTAMVAIYIPCLRRYASTLTGSQAKGDAYVRATLEAILADCGALPHDTSVRVALYRLFQAIWSSANLSGRICPNGEAQTVNADVATEQLLRRLSPSVRSALLLTSLEGFTREEVARILARRIFEVDLLLHAATACPWLRDDVKDAEATERSRRADYDHGLAQLSVWLNPIDGAAKVCALSHDDPL